MEELKSVAVHTSVGVSSGSEVSLGKGEGGRLELPQEKESLNDSVRRLQLSVEEFRPEQLQFAEKVIAIYCWQIVLLYKCCMPPQHIATVSKLYVFKIDLTGKEKRILIKYILNKNQIVLVILCL